MSVLIVATAPGLEEYEKVNAHIGGAASVAGVEFHAAGVKADGSVQIVTAFESQEAAEAFQRDKLFPAFQALGVMPEGAPPEMITIL